MCNHLHSYTPRHQFLAEMPEDKGVMTSLHWQTGLQKQGHAVAQMCRLVVLMKRFIYDAMDLGYMVVPLRWDATPGGGGAKGEVVSHGRVAKR